MYMAGKLSLLESIALKLSGIPGLRFLDSFVTNVHAQKTQIDDVVGDYAGYVDAAKDAAGDAKGAVSRKKTKDDDDEDDD
jgi:hypothetical protein